MDDAATVTKNRWSGIAGRSRWSRFAPLQTGLVGGFNTEFFRHVPIPYHQCQSTVTRITAHLQNLGIDFSERRVRWILIENKENFVNEAAAVLKAVLEEAVWISVADTGARHCGRNACPHA